MDMKISGCGTVTSGEYDKVSLSGSTKVKGQINCKEFSCSGSASGDADITCAGRVKASGSTHVKSITADAVTATGSLKIDGNCSVKGKFAVSGSTSMGGKLKASLIESSGSLRVDNDIEGEELHSSGTLNCKGLINAERIDIKFDHGMTIGSIGGSTISIHPHIISFIPIIALFSDKLGTVTIENSIEGDEVSIEDVNAQSVTGRIVTIGKRCNIKLVQYSERIDIDPDAAVEKVEKI
ncbi:MAG: hypothetical protein Q4F95_09285 [Oscillospiraceae bacterium]|nr:hypothetical protein [Oscillospiraceae bacterium]